jgi:hypothetical protein
MSSVVTRLPTDERDSADVPANLARWYAAHSSIRRLWAVEHRDELIARCFNGLHVAGRNVAGRSDQCKILRI